MARFALAFALALTLGVRAVSAQDTLRVDTVHVSPAHVVPADSAGFLSRAIAERFRRSLSSATMRPTLRVDWGLLPSNDSTVAGFETRVAQSRAEDEAAALRQHLFRLLGPRAADTTVGRRGLLGLSPSTAEVTFDGSLQFTINTTRTRNLACTPLQVQDVASGCSGGFKGPNITNTVLLTTRGVFAQRYHLNIDFDTQRDYSAGQIVSVYYQGLVDEKLQRVDVGTVQWQPPASRFFTATIPSNNFGISAEAVFGPFDVRAILATQKGSVVNTKSYTIGNGVVAPQDITTRDLDYEARRFFWVVNPRTLPGYPAVDILNAGVVNVTADSAPVDVRIYRYVAANQASGANANYDGITASASNGPTESVGALRWRLLKRNIDYWIDPSGLWFTLNNAISPNDYLAVSYTTKGGGTVGTVPVTDDSTRHDQLRLIYLPNRSAASPLFFYEMRQVYRVAGSSLVHSSLRAQLLVANSERPDSAAGTFLSLLGMALPSEQATLDIDNRLFPRLRDPGASQLIKDALLVFPNAQPFSDSRLTTRERNDSMYVTPEYLLSTQGPPSKFQLHLQFDAQGGTDRNGLALDGIQITEGSENLQLNGRRLVKDVDYSIDYTTGRVTFLNPNDLFGNGTATVTASFEQRGLFAIAPTSIAGITTTWNLGIGKSLSLSALYQAEATGYTRPQIGYEARASFLAGLTGDFTFNAPWLTGLVNKLVSKRTTAQSSFRITGEAAMSRPDPNRSGDAYLEQFEDDNSIKVVASENRWVPGSVPKAANGLLDIMPRGFDSTEAAQLIWQNLVPNAHDSILQYSPHDIDATIALTQSSSPTIEPVLWTTLHADTAGGVVDNANRSHWTMDSLPGHPRWRTMTTPLSPTGLDLSRNDYFEFAIYQTRDTIIKQAGMRMVIDLGKVSEDALAIAPTNFHVVPAGQTDRRFVAGDTVYTGRQYVGVGRLDTEKNYFGAWNALTDDLGILSDRPDTLRGPNGVILARHALCAANIGAQVALYPFGDLGARCSVANGAADTEDLDGDNILDAQGSGDDVFRYIINFKTDDSLIARRTLVFPDVTHLDTLHSATWTIYRIPLHSAHDTIGSPDIHLIKQMRLAFVAPGVNGAEKPVFFALALMRFSGAAWVARAARPIASLSGAEAGTHGNVIVGTVSTQDGDSTGRGYTSPPGIGDAASTVAVSSSQFSQQINEKSLSIIATDLRAGDRAEGYLHLSGGSQNLLSYTQLRVWMRGGARIGQNTTGEGWDDGRLRAYVKIGSDAYNFYLYNAPAKTIGWDPEMVIDLQVWQDLRQQIENARLHNPNPTGSKDLSGCGLKSTSFKGDTTAWIACSDDGAYYVQVRDPQINPPNLSAVQELAAGIYWPCVNGVCNPSLKIDHTELWIDDIRVGLPVSRTGYVAALSAQVQLADLASINLSGVYQDGNFHTLGQAPSYQNVGSLAATSVLHVEKLLPTRWGLIIPASVSSNWGWVDPQLINGTDVQANGIDGLRRPRSDATQWRFSINHPNRQNETTLSRLILSPFSLTASGSAGTNIAALSEFDASTWLTSLTYTLSNRRKTHPIHLGWLVAGLPKWFEESTAGKGIAAASYAPIPTLIQFSSALSHTMGDLQTYQLPITTLADTILKPVTSEQFLWHNQAAMNWEPLGILTFTTSWSSTRDLHKYPDSTSVARVANAAHESLLGADVGVERDRDLRNTILFAPRFSSWLTTSASISSSFILSRSLTSRNPVRIDGDTAGAYILPQTLTDSRQTLYRVSVDPRRLAQRLFGDSSSVSNALVQVQPILFTRQYTLQSTFDLARFNPDLGYQLALGGLDAFLNRNGERAIDAADGVATSVAATLDLPSGLSAQVNYTSTTSDRYQQATGTGFLKSSGETTSWPSGSIHWTQTFRTGPVLLVNASTSVQRDEATSTSPFSDGTGAVATSDTRRWSPDLTVRFRNNVSLRLTGQFDNSNASYAGNLTQTGSTTITGNVGWSVRMPHFLSATRRTMATTISLTQTGSNSCIQHTGDSTCSSYYDFLRREAHTGFTAFLAHGIHAGFDFAYIHNEVRSLKQITSTISLSALLSVPLNPAGM